VNRRNPAPSIRPLRRSELPADTVALARFLIGKVVVHDLPLDASAAASSKQKHIPRATQRATIFRGPTPRIRSMYLAARHAYIFFNYGAHFMLNVVSEPAAPPRRSSFSALEPLDGIQLMERIARPLVFNDLTRGSAASPPLFKSTVATTGLDLCAHGALWLGARSTPPVPSAIRSNRHHGAADHSFASMNAAILS